MTEWIYPNGNFSYDPRNDQIYPFPIAPLSFYESLKSYEQDMKYLISLYPDFINPMLRRIREVSDRYDYPGAFVYDRYPDKERILRISAEIYDELADDQGAAPSQDEDPLPSRTPPLLSFTKEPRNPYIVTLIQILFSNEIVLRRQSQNSRTRYWYGY